MPNYTNTYSERWENLTLANNFLFCKIMESEPELCRELLELLLHIKIDHLEKPVSERTVHESISSKSVRFDVYTKDDNRIFDVEMQTVNKTNLPKRARYYQSIIDVSNLNSGIDYDELKDTYIIFICLNDLFGKGHPVYTFKNICNEDRSVNLNDGTFKVFFNASACDKMNSAEERAFFNFLTGKSADTNFTRRLSEKMLLARENLEWRNQFMTFREQFKEELEEAKACARAETAVKVAEETHRKDVINAATNALKLGLSAEQAAKIAELPVEEVQVLQKKLQTE